MFIRIGFGCGFSHLKSKPNVWVHTMILGPFLENGFWGAWVAQSVEHLTSAQVVISWFMGSSLALGSVLTARSLEPALDSGILSPSLCPSPLELCLCLSLSLSKMNKD